jgi:thymidylate synthase (FAD)
MQIIRQSWSLEPHTLTGQQVLEKIESAGRTCYKSEGKIGPGTAAPFVAGIIKRGHESVLEHASVSVRIVTDRGVTHELVRHRLASYSQESTRYVSSAIIDERVTTEEEVVDFYLSGLSMRRIAELSEGKFTEWQVYLILDGSGVERRPLGNTGIVRDDYFETIDTVEKAYLLGLIQADGSVRGTDNPQISITQHEDYAWYLHRMVTDFIRPSASTSKDKQCRQITFTSPKLRDNLVEKGIVPNKTYVQTDEDIERLWSAIPPHLVPSFLRGFLDGDGGVRFFRQPNPGQTDSCHVNWSGHRALLEKISEWLWKNFEYRSIVRIAYEGALLHRLAITTPVVGDLVVKKMLEGFRWPYGHPAKTARMIDRVGGKYPHAVSGDPKFQVILPVGIENNPAQMWMWWKAMDGAERAYHAMRLAGALPELARSVLPNSLKTEVVMTMNVREFKHFFRLRTSKAAHPQMRDIARSIYLDFVSRFPVVFEGCGDLS